MFGREAGAQLDWFEFELVGGSSTDTIKPSGTFTFPSNGADIDPIQSASITGNATDENSGVDRVLVRIDRLTTNPVSFWNGNAWQNDSIFINVPFDNNGDFSVNAVDLSVIGDYRMLINVRDNAGNVASTSDNGFSFFTAN